MAAPNLLCSTKGMNRERWLEYRRHGPDGDIPFTIGGSDVGAVMGVSPWVTPLELWKDKTGIEPLEEPTNQKRMKMGQMMEPVIAYWFGQASGYEIIEDHGLYQHADYPFALANIDYAFKKPDGTEGIVEIKNTSYRNSDLWKQGICPLNYEYQLRFYLAVKDIEYGCCCGMWGNDPDNDMVIIPVYKDINIEKMIFDALEQFIDDCTYGREPSIRGTTYPERALRVLASHYRDYQLMQDAVSLNSSYESLLSEYLQLKEDKEYLNGEVANNKKNTDRVSLEIAELMGCHEYGVLDTAGGTYQVVWRPDNRNRRLTVKYRETELSIA